MPRDFSESLHELRVELRRFAAGDAAISARLELRLEPTDEAVSFSPPAAGEDRPDPRVRELAAELAKRTAKSARFRARVLVRGR